MTYVNAPFMKKVLYITKRKWKTNIHHYGKSDDFRARLKVAKWRMLCHSAWLQISPARLKQVYSDSTIITSQDMFPLTLLSIIPVLVLFKA